VIEASGGGVFVPPGDDERLAQVIRELADDPARVKRMGEQARAYLVQNFDRRDKLSETLELFQRLAS
jgi:glycosyltransferase involved in cell wall biosynthesis